jgi:MSHA biogenesis protein MshJ
MKAWLASFWDARAARERIVLAAAGVCLLALAADGLLLAPTRVTISHVRAELAGAQAELDRVHASIEEQARRNEGEIQARRAALAQRREHADAVIRATQDDLITPQQMQRQLAAILERFPQLRVVGLTVQAPVAVDAAAPASGSGAQAAGTPAAGSAPDPAARPAAGRGTRPAQGTNIGLYQHGMDITVAGRYLDLIAYLQALEHAPYRIYWRELSLAVDDKGQPVTRIAVFTLSRDMTWLAL